MLLLPGTEPWRRTQSICGSAKRADVLRVRKSGGSDSSHNVGSAFRRTNPAKAGSHAPNCPIVVAGATEFERGPTSLYPLGARPGPPARQPRWGGGSRRLSAGTTAATQGDDYRQMKNAVAHDSSRTNTPVGEHGGWTFLKRSCGRAANLSRRRAPNVCVVFFVFEAVVLEQIGIREQLFDDAEGDRLGEGLGIGDCDGEIEMAVIAAAEAFLDAHVRAVAGATCVQPAQIVEAGGLDHQRVTFPSADRVPLPRR